MAQMVKNLPAMLETQVIVPEIVLSGSVETWGSVGNSRKGVCVGTLSARSTESQGRYGDPPELC